MTHDIRLLDAAAATDALQDLVAILVDCVNGGASVGFMNPFGPDDAEPWWRGVIAEVAAGRTMLFAAVADGTVAGTAQLIPATKPNQPHRADVSKLLVRSSARGRGLGAALMRAVEEEARGRNLRLLVLDTATGSDAERLYPRMGWERTGVIPDYALWPDGGLCDTTVFYKRLTAEKHGS